MIDRHVVWRTTLYYYLCSTCGSVPRSPGQFLSHLPNPTAQPSGLDMYCRGSKGAGPARNRFCWSRLLASNHFHLSHLPSPYRSTCVTSRSACWHNLANKGPGYLLVASSALPCQPVCFNTLFFSETFCRKILR